MPDLFEGPAERTVVRVDVDHGGRIATYLVGCRAFSVDRLDHFYAHAGDLLGALSALEARPSPTEGSLLERVSRHARTVAAEPGMEAAIGFFDWNGENGLVRITGV